MRWLRLYDDTINDPKILKLPEATRWHWVALLCVASKNEGSLPALDDISIQLRVTAAKATEIIATLVKVGLLDKTEKGFAPHNWNGRQYKTDTVDPTAASRSKRYRDKKRVTRDDRDDSVSYKRPETETETDAETEIPEAIASDANASADPRTRLFQQGLAKVAVLTGKGPDSCRSFLGKCLKEAGDDAVVVLAAIEDAERNRVVDPSAYIARLLKGRSNGLPQNGIVQAADDLIRKLASFDGPVRTPSRVDDLRGRAGEAPVRLLSNRNSE